MANIVENPKKILVRAGAAVLTLASLGLGKDSQANLGNQDFYSSDYHPALEFNLPNKVELPNVPVPVGEYETISHDGVEITRIYGVHEPDRRLSRLILLQNGADMDMAKRLVQDSFIAEPMPKYVDKFTYWVRRSVGVEDLKCNQIGICDFMAIKREMDRTIAKTGIFFQKATALTRSNTSVSQGRAMIDRYPNPPSIYAFCSLVMPKELIDDEQRLGVDHEDGHCVNRFGDGYKVYMVDGVHSNINMGFPNCSRMPVIWRFAPTSYIGCDRDETAYKAEPPLTSIMDHSSIGRYTQRESEWIAQIMDILPSSYRLPELSFRSIDKSGLNISAGIDIPYGFKQLKYELIPFNNDGPGIQMMIGDPNVMADFRNKGLKITAPELGVGNYVLLPDMSYRLRAWVSDAKTSLTWSAPEWETYRSWPIKKDPSPSTEIAFHTEKKASDGITAVSPANGETVNTPQAVLRWANRDLEVFYYEVRTSSDCQFKTNPDEAEAPVWHNLIHGGLTKPLNSWETPKLELGKEWCWQVKPRVQGDGREVEWSETYRFSTPPPSGLKKNL